jgi:membrane protease YdiL (CAAX protease family)
MAEEHWSRWAIVGLAVGFEGGLALLAVGLGWLLGQPPLAGIQWDAHGLLWGAAGSLPMLALFAICLRWPVGPLRRIRSLSLEFIRPLFQSCSLLELAVICLLAGLGEELLFRGVLQPVLARRLGVAGGLVLSNVLFGLLHPLTRTYMVLSFLLGLYLGALGLWSGNLLTVIVAHGLYDFLALCYLVRRPISS